MAKEIMLMKEVWVPSEKPFTFKEQIDPRTGEQSYILKGLILPFNKVSRNNVLYNMESVKEKHKQIIGRPVMYNHKLEGTELPKGHFINSTIVEKADDEHPVPGWYYEADIDPQEKDLIRKLERQDLRHVSIQLVGGKVVERMGDKGPYSEAFVSDIIEGSLVPAPGFLDTTALFSEAFKETKTFPVSELEYDKIVDKRFLKLKKEWEQGDEQIDSKTEDMLFEKATEQIDAELKARGIEVKPGDSRKLPKAHESMDGHDSPIIPFDDGENAKTDEELAGEYMEELGEDTVKDLLERYF